MGGVTARGTRRLVVAALVALFALGSPSLARAEPAAGKAASAKPAAGKAASAQPGAGAATASPAQDAAGQARAHFERALDAYREGRYERAVTELEQAVKLDPEGKDLYYNLGLVHEKLGNLDRALFYFRRYLELETLPAERERVEVMVQRLAGAEASAQRTAAAEGSPASDASPQEAPQQAGSAARGRWDRWVWISGGVAVTSLALGVVYGVRALAAHPGGSPRSGPGQSAGELQRNAARAHDYALVADASFGIALVSGVAAAVLYFGREPEPRRADQRAAQGRGPLPRAASASRAAASGARTSGALVAVPYGISFSGQF